MYFVYFLYKKIHTPGIFLLMIHFLQVLLQGIPPNANLEDIERFLAGCEYDPSNIRQFSRSMLNCLKLTRPALGFLILLMINVQDFLYLTIYYVYNSCWQGPSGPTRMALVRFISPTTAMTAMITKNRGFCNNNQISMQVPQ